MIALNIFRLVGDLMHLLSIFLLVWKIRTTRSCAGLSLKSQILYFAVYVTRYLDFFITIHADFLHIYNAIMKLFFLSSQALVLYFMMNKYRASYDPRMDSFRIMILLIPSAILAYPAMSTRFAHTAFQYICEYFWTFSVLLEAVAILPQLFQLERTGEAESITTHYLFCLGLYRAFYILNWIYRWTMRQHVETVAVIAGIVQTALYSDLFYIYYNRVFRGQAFKLPI